MVSTAVACTVSLPALSDCLTTCTVALPALSHYLHCLPVYTCTVSLSHYLHCLAVSLPALSHCLITCTVSLSHHLCCLNVSLSNFLHCLTSCTVSMSHYLTIYTVSLAASHYPDCLTSCVSLPALTALFHQAAFGVPVSISVGVRC